jgi:hypothetical protein
VSTPARLRLAGTPGDSGDVEKKQHGLDFVLSGGTIPIDAGRVPAARGLFLETDHDSIQNIIDCIDIMGKRYRNAIQQATIDSQARQIAALRRTIAGLTGEDGAAGLAYDCPHSAGYLKAADALKAACQSACGAVEEIDWTRD